MHIWLARRYDLVCLEGIARVFLGERDPPQYTFAYPPGGEKDLITATVSQEVPLPLALSPLTNIPLPDPTRPSLLRMSSTAQHQIYAHGLRILRRPPRQTTPKHRAQAKPRRHRNTDLDTLTLRSDTKAVLPRTSLSRLSVGQQCTRPQSSWRSTNRTNTSLGTCPSSEILMSTRSYMMQRTTF
ncbi:hypothetical protein BDR05DRAFT_398167 [Suillus weaverae]|nr:hypothetical protein BDR05DRAFT_398167 [Suillus weaverae]